MAIKTSSGASGLRNNKLIFASIAALVALVFIGTLMLLKSVYQTETYYVLSEDIPTRTQVAPENLAPITTSKGTAPQNAKGMAEIQSGDFFTKYPLKAGDVLTDSNVGALEDIATGVPDSWVVTSFGVSADNAVGGRIHRGDYADFMVATANGAYYPFVNMLVLDTSISLSSASSNNAANTKEAKQGQTSQYTVAGTPENMGKLQQIMKKNGGDVKLLLSPRQNQYKQPVIADYSDGGGMFKYVQGDQPVNLGKDTDASFVPPKRDKFGRPVATPKNCSQGNGKVDASLCNGQAEAPADAPTEAPAN